MEDRNKDSNQKGMDDQPLDLRKHIDTQSAETHPSENPTETAKEVNRLAPTYEANLGAKRQRTFESTSNKNINNNPERFPVVDCSDTTMPVLISAIPSTSGAQYLSSSGPGIETFPTNNKPESCNVCEQCGKAFIDRHTLKRHYITHSTERPYSCKDCKKNFKRKDDFKKHIRLLHTGERLLTCSECGKKFTSASGLSAHENIHTGDKPYICRTCGKAFNHISSKTRHEKICE